MWAGKAMMDEAAGHAGWWWAAPVGVVASALTAGAVLRVWLRVFRGLGPAEGGASEEEERETRPKLSRLPWTMLLPGLVLVVSAIAAGLISDLGRGVSHAAALFVDHRGYAAAVLYGRTWRAASAAVDPWTPEGVGGGLVGVALAALVAVVTLYRHAPHALRPLTARLRDAHSGHIGDYAAWLTVGVAFFGLLMFVA